MEDRPRHDAVRLPGVADLPSQVAGVPALAPVPLVGVEPGLEFAAKERREAGGEACRRLGFDEPLDDEKAVAVKSGDLVAGRLVDKKHLQPRNS